MIAKPSFATVLTTAQTTVLTPALTGLLVLLLPLPAQAQRKYTLHSFDKTKLDADFHCEGASFGDLNRDGKPDVISGPFWYEGPGFTRRHEFYKPHPFDVKRYSDNFFVFVYDFDADGWNDILVIGFPGKDASWFRNPQGAEGHWQRHLVFDVVDNESPTFTDLTGDGKPELVCQTADRMGYATPDWSAPEKKWQFHPISAPKIGGRFTHGLGVGDVNGDGRKDILWKMGWWEQPASLSGDPAWELHLQLFGGRGGAQIYTYDVDGDGDTDVISSHNAHGFGLYWFEQVKKDGKIAFERHRIMGQTPQHNPYGVAIGNLHAIDLVDMDRDGLKDIITGNRYWAHGGNDKADHDKASVYWFKLVRAAEGAGAHFVPHLIDEHSGVGVQVVAGDLNGDDYPDVVVGNKMGTFVHIQKCEEVSRNKWMNNRREFLKAAAARRDAAVIDRTKGFLPKGEDGKPLNLDFETGDLRDWTATGDAFAGAPIKGDTVRQRRSGMSSNHAGEYWVGTYEKGKSDQSRGTLTSKPFAVTGRYASFLLGGGRSDRTRVELVLASDNQVFYKISGRNEEEMHPESIDLEKYVGQKIYIRLVDEVSGGWGHINFDDFLLHEKNPWSGGNYGRNDAKPKQQDGYAPAEAARQMTVPEGFQVSLVAGEPDVHQPIAFCVDEKGRVWVAEAHSYPTRRKDSEAVDQILVFEDTDANGSFDKRTVFAKNLNLISGLEVGFGGVWVGAAPYFMFIPDKDGDLVPDGEPQILLDGWGYQDTHETLNAFNWGPDGWLYGCHGVFTHSKVGKPGTPDDQRVRVNAAVWRYHPTRHRFEVFAWGASNQWGVDFNDLGQAFITACVIPHLYHVVQGARYHRQSGQHFNRHVYDDIKTIADHLHYLGSKPHAGNGVSDSVGGGHAHCGAMVYLGDSFPEQYRNTIFMANVHGNRINTDVLIREGSGYVGSHGPDFLLANDKWFRGINMRYGPDGSVYLIDWYDKQACHLRQPEVWDRSNGRIYRVSYGDPRPEKAIDVAALDDRQLVELQLHKNDWHVRNARRVLQERGGNPKVHQGLLAILQGDVDVTRHLRALWALHVTGGLSESLARQLLDSQEEHLRAWTIQLTTEDGAVSEAIADKMAALAESDPSPVVRLYLASALQRVPAELRWRLAAGLVAHGEDDGDHNLPLMVWYGVESLVAADPKRALELLARCKLPRVERFIYRRLANAKAAGLQALIAVLRGSSAERIPAVVEEMADALEKLDSVPMPAGWEQMYPLLAKSTARGVRENAQTIAVVFGDRQVLPEIRAVLADRGAPLDRREWALDNLLRVKDAAVVPVLHALLDDPKIAGRAIRGLARFDDERTPAVLLGAYQDLNQARRTAVVDTLSSRVPYAKALLTAVVDRKLPKSVLDSAATRRQIRGLNNGDVQELLERAWGRIREVGKDKRQLIDQWKAKLGDDVLAAADLSAGRAVFAKTCMACHKLFGQGMDIGPDITGSNRDDLDYILTNIIDPNGEVAKEYMLTSVETKDGGVFSGMIVDDNENTITLRGVTGERQQIARRTIAVQDGKPAITTLPISLMPEGQLLGLTEDEAKNLIAYLGADRQVPMLATEGSLPTFFNMRDLTNWDADPNVWSVENGEIVGRTKTGLKRNNFARSHMVFGDFRLTVDVKLTANQGNSGIQFRSQNDQGDLMKGYQADIGVGWWGKLYEEHGRALLFPKNSDHTVKPGEWNTYEILAVGSRIRTAINGQPCVDLDDPKGARTGIFGLQVHSGGPTEVRFRNFRLELNPH